MSKFVLFQRVRRRAAVAGAAGPGAERVRRGRAAVFGAASADHTRHASHARNAGHRRRLTARGTHLRGRWIHEHERKKVRPIPHLLNNDTILYKTLCH